MLWCVFRGRKWKDTTRKLWRSERRNSVRNTSDFKSGVRITSIGLSSTVWVVCRVNTHRTHIQTLSWGFLCYISFSKSHTHEFLLCRITGSVNINACFGPVFYNFLAPTAQEKKLGRGAKQGWNWGTFHCFGQNSVWVHRHGQPRNTTTVPPFHTNTVRAFPPHPPHSSHFDCYACFAMVFGTGPNLWWSLELVFFSSFFFFLKTGTFLTAPESQQPAYVSGEFHERNHPALSSRISHGRFLSCGLNSAWTRSKHRGDRYESAGIFRWFIPLPERRRRNTQSCVLKGQYTIRAYALTDALMLFNERRGMTCTRVHDPISQMTVIMIVLYNYTLVSYSSG